MPKLSRILVPVEFSPRCLGAAQYAESLSNHFHCEIVLLHVVIPPLANFSSFEAMAYSSAADLAREIAEQRKTQLAAFPCGTLPGCVVRREVVEGDPASVICDFAAHEKCNLIVMPTRGYGPFRRFLLGSVTANVLHDALCPVWTGPHMEIAPSFESLRFHTVVGAIDLGLHSREVLCWAAGFAADIGAKLNIVHAIPASATRLGGFYFDPDWRVQLTRTAADRIEFLCEDMSIREASVAIEAGDPPVVVDAAAEALHADLLVIGRGSTPRAHGHLPTNAYAIVRGSKCPVVTV